MFGIHPDLGRRTAVVVLASAGSGAVGLFLLWGYFGGDAELRTAPLPVLIVMSALLLFVAYLGVFATPRWYREATRAFATATPISGKVTLHIYEDDDTRSLSAKVDLATGERRDVLLTFPGWDVRPLVGSARAALVYLRSGSSEVVAVVIDRGRLWAMLPPRHALPHQ